MRVPSLTATAYAAACPENGPSSRIDSLQDGYGAPPEGSPIAPNLDVTVGTQFADEGAGGRGGQGAGWVGTGSAIHQEPEATTREFAALLDTGGRRTRTAAIALDRVAPRVCDRGQLGAPAGRAWVPRRAPAAPRAHDTWTLELAPRGWPRTRITPVPAQRGAGSAEQGDATLGGLGTASLLPYLTQGGCGRASRPSCRGSAYRLEVTGQTEPAAA